MQSIYPVLKYAAGESGVVVHAELRFGEAVVMLSSAGAGDPAYDQGLGRTTVYVVVDEVDSLHERARDAGAEIFLAPTDQDYGSRDFSARDPEGNIWSFGTYRPELDG